MAERLTSNAEQAAKADAINLRSVVRQRDDLVDEREADARTLTTATVDLEQANARVDVLTEERAPKNGEAPAPHAFKVGDRVRFMRPSDATSAVPPIGWESASSKRTTGRIFGIG